MSRLFFTAFPICGSSHAAAFQKTLGKIALGGKPGVMGHLRNAVVRVGQELFAGLDAGLAQITDGRTAVMQRKGVNHIIFV